MEVDINHNAISRTTGRYKISTCVDQIDELRINGRSNRQYVGAVLRTLDRRRHMQLMSSVDCAALAVIIFVAPLKQYSLSLSNSQLGACHQLSELQHISDSHSIEL